MENITVKVKCRVYVNNEYPIRATIIEQAEGKRFAICDVCDVSGNEPACFECWKHVRDVLESETVVYSGMHIK